jgi:hypothetical protein
MIYLAHPDGRIEACERAVRAEMFETRGFKRCSPDLYAYLWEKQAMRRLRELRDAAMVARTRAWVQTAPLSAASGMARYGMNGQEIK